MTSAGLLIRPRRASFPLSLSCSRIPTVHHPTWSTTPTLRSLSLHSYTRHSNHAFLYCKPALDPHRTASSSRSRFYSSASWLGRFNSSNNGSRFQRRPFFISTTVFLATATLLFTIFPSNTQVLAESPLHDDDRATQGHDEFAPPIEVEDLFIQSNVFVRTFCSFKRFLHVYIIEPLGTAKRFIFLVFLFAPVLLTAPMLVVGNKTVKTRQRGQKASQTQQGERCGAVWWYSFLVKQMERAGPTFIKLAQWAGSRQDLFPDELCQKLARLHSNGKPHSFRYTKKLIEKVFQRPFDEIFQQFQHEPMGIGAVAQVYKATLKPDLLPPSYLEAKNLSPAANTPAKISQTLALAYDEHVAPPKIPTAAVAIKILHPRVEKTISRDIKIMKFFANLINLIPAAEWLSFPEEVDVFAAMMFSQLDLRNEAQNLKRFEKNFSKRRSPVSFPRPLIEFSTNQMLIEEYQDALPLKYFLSLGGDGFEHRIANFGLDAFLNMLLIDNFTHADLHPGNIMIKFYKPSTRSLLQDAFARILSKFDSDYAPGNSKAPPSVDERAEESIVRKLRPLRHDAEAWLNELRELDAQGYQPELVFLDAGLTVELHPTNRHNFLDLFAAIAEFDGALAGHLMVERCKTPELVIDEDMFAIKMQDLVLGVKSKTFSLAKIKISDILTQVLLNVRQHHVKMEADFVNTVISVLLLEGIGRQLDPDMDLFKSSLPILRSLGRDLSKSEGKRIVQDAKEMKQVLPMLKLWLYMEARSILSGLFDANVSTLNAFMKYGWHSD